MSCIRTKTCFATRSLIVCTHYLFKIKVVKYKIVQLFHCGTLNIGIFLAFLMHVVQGENMGVSI